MPYRNEFCHQKYQAHPPVAEYELVCPAKPPEVGSEEFRRRLAAAGLSMSRAGVRVIYLLHGTLAGTDVSGLVGELGRIVPKWARQLQRQQKWLVDAIAGDSGNYDDVFVTTLQDGINAQLDSPIEVKRFLWSSQNHHVGRADAAVRLIEELISAQIPDHQRVQLWGHSHAGNVLALATNLIGGDMHTRRAFFQAARPYYRVPCLGWVDVPVWEAVRQVLDRTGSPLGNVKLDLVTFGTPVRYGWETGGYAQLLHVINHRPVPNLPEYLAAFPPTLSPSGSTEYGDAIQPVFIAGTNFPPNVLAWRAFSAERRLKTLFHDSHHQRGLWDRLKLGLRVPDEGQTLLVDYAAGDPDTARQLGGHIVYTKQEWLPFHLEMITSRFYEAAPNEPDEREC